VQVALPPQGRWAVFLSPFQHVCANSSTVEVACWCCCLICVVAIVAERYFVQLHARLHARCMPCRSVVHT
jgi:hypothetical protein